MHYNTLAYDAGAGDKQAAVLLAELEGLTHPTRFDYVGTGLLLAASVLTIFGLTDGSEGGGWCVLCSSSSAAWTGKPLRSPHRRAAR